MLAVVRKNVENSRFSLSFGTITNFLLIDISNKCYEKGSDQLSPARDWMGEYIHDMLSKVEIRRRYRCLGQQIQPPFSTKLDTADLKVTCGDLDQ